jgi:hypothetical protein
MGGLPGRPESRREGDSLQESGRIGITTGAKRISRMKIDQNQQFNIIGESEQIQSVRQDINYIAQKNLAVFILGQSGTGKELIAHEIHSKSLRNSNRIEIVNCAAIPPDLFESEMFGYEKGAFTGALKKRVGRIEQAHGGTLFLDEIGDLRGDHQAKILRFMNDKTYKPLGSKASEKTADVRIISATNKDLPKNATFRQDLFSRLSEYIIRTPPLAGRHEDIVLLTNHFPVNSKIDSRSKVLLYSSDFSTGNVRELKNLVVNGDNYSYVQREILRGWCSILGDDPDNPSMIDDLFNREFDKVYSDRQNDDERASLLMDLKKKFRIRDAISFIENNPERRDDAPYYDYDKPVRAYEIVILKSRTKLSNHEIAKRLHTAADSITEKGFNDRFGLSLDGILEAGDIKFNYLYPDFIGYWNRCKVIRGIGVGMAQ